MSGLALAVFLKIYFRQRLHFRPEIPLIEVVEFGNVIINNGIGSIDWCNPLYWVAFWKKERISQEYNCQYDNDAKQHSQESYIKFIWLNKFNIKHAELNAS